VAVRVLKHQKRCKFCAAAKSAEVNLVLERVRNGDIGRVAALVEIEALGVVRPSIENIKSHFYGKTPHVEVIPDEVVQEENAQRAEIVRKIGTGEIEMADLDEGLRFLATVYLEQQRDKYADGKDLGLTHDHFLKLVGESTKRKTNDAQAKLLDALGGGIGMVFEKALRDAPHAPAIEAGDVIDADVTEVIEDA